MNRYATSTAILLATLLFASQALALDGYRDRRGLFYGVTLGGASFKADIAGSKRNLGYTFGGKVGGGVSERFTLDGSLNFQLQDYDQSGIAVKTNSTEMLVGGNYFLTIDQAKNGLFLRGEVGLVSQSTEVLGAESDETGLVVGGGLGYEFFASADLAVGIGATYKLQQFDDANVSVLQFAITANWY